MKLGIGVNLFKRREQKGTPIRDGLVAEYRFDEGRGRCYVTIPAMVITGS
jgi:hypothetical protein